MRRICQCLERVLVGSRYPELVCRLSPYIVYSITSLSANTSIIERVTATLSFFCVIMCGKYSLAGRMSNCSPFHRRLR